MKFFSLVWVAAFASATKLNSQEQIDVQNMLFGSGESGEKQVRVIAFKNEKGTYEGINCATNCCPCEGCCPCGCGGNYTPGDAGLTIGLEEAMIKE